MTFDPQPLDRDHMIKRNGTSLSLVQKTRGVGLFDTNTQSDAPYYYELSFKLLINEEEPLIGADSVSAPMLAPFALASNLKSTRK